LVDDAGILDCDCNIVSGAGIDQSPIGTISARNNFQPDHRRYDAVDIQWLDAIPLHDTRPGIDHGDMGGAGIIGIGHLLDGSPQGQPPALTPPPSYPGLTCAIKKQAPEASACFHKIEWSL
jgi:hypothetical protein